MATSTWPVRKKQKIHSAFRVEHGFSGARSRIRRPAEGRCGDGLSQGSDKWDGRTDGRETVFGMESQDLIANGCVREERRRFQSRVMPTQMGKGTRGEEI